MSTKKVTEVVIGILLLLVEIIVVIVFKYQHNNSFLSMMHLTHYLVIFTNIDVIYVAFLLLINLGIKSDNEKENDKENKDK